MGVGWSWDLNVKHAKRKRDSVKARVRHVPAPVLLSGVSSASTDARQTL